MTSPEAYSTLPTPSNIKKGKPKLPIKQKQSKKQKQKTNFWNDTHKNQQTNQPNIHSSLHR